MSRYREAGQNRALLLALYVRGSPPPGFGRVLSASILHPVRPSNQSGKLAMRTAVYALAGLAAASGVSAFMPQAHFAGRAPSLRTARAGRSTVAVGMPSRPAAPFRMSLGMQQMRTIQGAECVGMCAVRVSTGSGWGWRAGVCHNKVLLFVHLTRSSVSKCIKHNTNLLLVLKGLGKLSGGTFCGSVFMQTGCVFMRLSLGDGLFRSGWLSNVVAGADGVKRCCP